MKKYKIVKTGQYLHFKEALNREYHTLFDRDLHSNNFMHTLTDAKELGLIVEDNSPQDILEATKEMLNRMEGTFQYSQEEEKLMQLQEVAKLKEKRIQEENQARRELDKIHRKRITDAEKERSNRLEEARKLIEEKIKEEEEIRLKEEKKRKLIEEEERKIKATETRKLQEEEVRRSGEIEKENLKKMQERISNKSTEQEKVD